MPHWDVYSRQCTAGASCDWMVMEYTHDDYCDMLLNVGTVELLLANLFRWLEQRLPETRITTTVHLNPGLTGTVGTPANEGAIVSTVEWKPWRSVHDYPKRESTKYFMMMNWIHTITRGAHTYLQTILPFGCNFANGYDINTLRWSSLYIIFCGQTKYVLRIRVCSTSTVATSGYGKILFLSKNVGLFQRQCFDWNRRGHFRGPLSATWGADCSTMSWFSGNCCTGPAWRHASSYHCSSFGPAFGATSSCSLVVGFWCGFVL
jgi:hypothetical protein